MKYKPLDKVRIKSLEWYNENKDEYGYVRCIDFLFTPEHSKYCGCEFTISHITEFRIPSYVMEGNGHEWTDEMIECKVDEEMSLDKAGQITDFEYDGLAYTLPDGYQFVDEKGNVINATKIVLEKKKKEYPKTYGECEKILGLEDSIIEGCLGYEYKLLNAFQKLLMCRDAYWKTAGEEMGLGKPWEPDWKSLDPQYIILYQYGGLDEVETHGEGNYILTFPTEEMRDAFYENFKELINECKELL